jgi:hypothetical protein
MFSMFLAVILLSGCLYSQVIIPLDTNVQNTEFGSKVGRASSHSILSLIAWGDSGVFAASKEAGITNVKHLDTELFIILFGVYVRSTTIAYGD